jgi:hypothetical protein
MLQTAHRSKTYRSPKFAFRRRIPRPRGYSQIFARCTRVVEIPVENNPLRIDNADDFSIEEFLRDVEPLRNELAYRRLMNEPLSQKEQLVLSILNLLLSNLLEKPSPEPPAVTQAVEDAKLLLHQLEHGQNRIS